jgi:cation:H+ antiporter
MMILLSIFFIAVSCVIIWRASNGFEAASEYLGRNLTDGVRGATINAIGSSMPELITTLFFLFVLKDKDGFAGGIGTTAGSAIFNGMIIPAVVILVVVLRGVTRHVEVSKKVLLRDGISLLICEIVLIFLLGGETLNWIHGLVLMLLYAAYSIYLLTSMKKNSADETEAEEDDDDEDEDSGEEHSSSTLMQVITLDLEPLVIKK